MLIELDKHTRTEAIASLQRYAEENLSEPLGTLPATLLLDYFLEEIGPAIYNQAIADAQTRILQRTSDLAGELFTDPFTYWQKKAAKNRTKK
ncbi:DUF2164 family protein [Granulicella sp. 5B5]|uniref:DUF2164 domain-containing protein n=1 Tax=Granulicella sp. 5B5 TaxID=1617967 RepID=UPI0015F48DE4|nr:DUF2164 domain-containing protein [Granulicella sp. 5B5]QMV17534.1 DUF2164 family protein [Granulicella sp. 5B5]